MKLRILFIVTIAALVALLGFQLATVKEDEPQVLYYASWVNLANSLAEADSLSTQIVLGRVMEVRPGPDLVAELPEEPGGVDRIPIEVVCISVEKAYKGSPGGRLALFHTGLSTPGSLDETDAIPPEETPPPQDDEEPLGPSTGGQERSIILEDDPPYQLGERYVLFLTDGPAVNDLPTMAVIAPEGRYLVAAEDQLQPVTSRGFAPQVAGSSLQALEMQLPPSVPTDADDAGCPSVGGVAALSVRDGGSPFPWMPLAAVAASVTAVIGAGLWYGRRRWLR